MKIFQDLEVGDKFTDPTGSTVPPLVYIKVSENEYCFAYDRKQQTKIKLNNLAVPVLEYEESSK